MGLSHVVFIYPNSLCGLYSFLRSPDILFWFYLLAYSLSFKKMTFHVDMLSNLTFLYEYRILIFLTCCWVMVARTYMV